MARLCEIMQKSDMECHVTIARYVMLHFGNRALYCACLIELNLFAPASIYLKSRLES